MIVYVCLRGRERERKGERKRKRKREIKREKERERERKREIKREREREINNIYYRSSINWSRSKIIVLNGTYVL